ncbi:MAG: single-stranded DNA-binding protein [Bacteroidales bacterium]|nr:single-stranded DNA-binding protein [Bacteroidales bacterium]
MASLNRVEIIGYLGAEPKIEKMQSGNIKATLSVATTDKGYTTKGGSVIPERTEWHSIVFWGAMASACERLLKKSMCIYVDGKLRTRGWEDKNGLKHYRTEIEGDSFQILDRVSTPPAQQDAPQEPAMPQQRATTASIGTGKNDDLPF